MQKCQNGLITNGDLFLSNWRKEQKKFLQNCKLGSTKSKPWITVLVHELCFPRVTFLHILCAAESHHVMLIPTLLLSTQWLSREMCWLPLHPHVFWVVLRRQIFAIVQSSDKQTNRMTTWWLNFSLGYKFSTLLWKISGMLKSPSKSVSFKYILSPCYAVKQYQAS